MRVAEGERARAEADGSAAEVPSWSQARCPVSVSVTRCRRVAAAVEAMSFAE